MTQSKTGIASKSGWLKPKNNRGNLVVDFNLNKSRYNFAPIPKAKYDNISDYRQVCLVCEEIELDIRRGQFDTTLNKYKAKFIPVIVPDKALLGQMWIDYKADKADIIELTTQKSVWKSVDRLLLKCGLADCSDLSEVYKKVRAKYSPSHSLRCVEALCAAVSNSQDKGADIQNPLLDALKVLKKDVAEHQRKNGTTSCKAFNKAERDAIIDAFVSDRFNPPDSRFAHSYYANMVKFRFLTGCRPEEVYALTWGDIDLHKIAINKAYSKGELKSTKTNHKRVIPVNPELRKVLISQQASLPSDRVKPHTLVFPAVQGGYICQKTFNRNNWQTVVRALVELKEVQEYLPSYNMRHTFITQCLNAGVPVHQVANWVGNKVEVLLERYVGADAQVQIPSLS